MASVNFKSEFRRVLVIFKLLDWFKFDDIVKKALQMTENQSSARSKRIAYSERFLRVDDDAKRIESLSLLVFT